MQLRTHTRPFEWPGISGQLCACARPGGGSTGGRWFQDDDGTPWFLKSDPYHASLQSSAEVVSARVLATLGYPVPETHKLVVGEVHLSAARDVGEAIATTHFETLHVPAVRELRVFAAYLRDWDRIAPRSTNNLVHADGQITLIDFGGSLGARALGRHKPGPVSHKAIGCFPASRDIREIWGGFQFETRADHPWLALGPTDIDAALTKLARLDDQTLEEIVGLAAYPDQVAHATMVSALGTRRDTLVGDLRAHLGA